MSKQNSFEKGHHAEVGSHHATDPSTEGSEKGVLAPPRHPVGALRAWLTGKFAFAVFSQKTHI